MNDNQFPPLLGYADRLSARPGDLINVKVSSYLTEDFTASMVRIVCADVNPEGIGIIEKQIDCDFKGNYQSRIQPFTPGSYIHAPLPPTIIFPDQFTFTANIWPTSIGSKAQTVFSVGPDQFHTNFLLGLDADGQLECRLRVSDNNWIESFLNRPLNERQWAFVWASYNDSSRELMMGYSQANTNKTDHKSLQNDTALSSKTIRSMMFAASNENKMRHRHFNGKIELPTIYSQQLDLEAITPRSNTLAVPIFARWDFSHEISSTKVIDIGPNKINGKLVNYPARAMTGSNWDGSEMCWRHAPQQYGAIHFHEDDIYDFQWDTDFSFTIPKDLRSGIYGIRLETDEYQDTIPLFVCPPVGIKTSKLCVLVSTFTYVIYGNHARPDYEASWLENNKKWNSYPWNPAEYPHYGLSTYNFHSDRSGICHASHRRPLFNLRPGYRTFGANKCSGIRHFQADSHLMAWLEEKGYEFDIVTDKELNEEGIELLSGYTAVTTGSHPEYHTSRTLDALKSYRDQGGRLAYLGGNGFYWRVGLHPENDSIIEIRRGEGGIRAWAAEPGEYFNAFDGLYGGLWRRNGRPPQSLVGVGFSAQGNFFGSYYRRTEASYRDDVNWIFEGIDDETLGDFGFCGGGAAGFELDRFDRNLGSPNNAIVIASSENHSETFVMVPEEQLTHITNWVGVNNKELIRADMTYFDTPKGGAVFSVGSITFCGSLPCNNFDNNISALLTNVLNRFLRD